MYLKSLELHGFKSFPNRTVMTFERGATVIVGPNGSGKSNISDAMRWVLGELSSRNIRGTKMEDVIFGGTDTRRPMGFAEVSVTFDNTDDKARLDSPYDEITVTRRYYRTGESNYLINGVACRLKDIYKLFLNTGVGREGYSIISQGKINDILSRKSDDRRGIFEEAAGISKYREDKAQAERNLANNQNDLNRVRDILFEVESRVEPLAREAEKARKGIEITEQKKIVDVALWLFDTEKLRGDLKTAEEQFKLVSSELEGVTEALASLERQRETLRQKNSDDASFAEAMLAEMTDLTEKMHELDQIAAGFAGSIERSELIISQAEAALASANDNENTLREEREELKKKLEAIKETADRISDERLELLAELQEVSSDLSSTDKELQDSLVALNKLEHNAVDFGVRLNFLERTTNDEDGKGSDILREIKNYEETAERLKAEADRCEASAKEFRDKIADAEAKIATAKEKIEDLREERENELEKLNELKVEKNTLLQSADALRRMEQHLEGYSGSVRFVMKEYADGKIRTAGDIYGPLSQLLTIEQKYILAVENALGPNLQHIVVDNEQTAKAAILYLKQASGGRATFFPISSMSPQIETEEGKRAASMKGFIDRADRLVNTDNKFRGIVESLLVRTVVFDNIDNATEAAKALRFRIKIVTLDGQIINAGGSFTGGSAKRDSGILSRSADIAKLEKQAEEKNALIESVRSNIAEIESEIKEAGYAIDDGEQEKNILSGIAESQITAANQAKANYEANENILSRLREDYASFDSTKTHAQNEAESLQKSLARCNSDMSRLRSSRQTQSESRDALLRRKEELTVIINEVNGKNIALSKDIEVLENELLKNGEGLAEAQSKNESQKRAIREENEKIRETVLEREKNRKNYEALTEFHKAALEKRNGALERIEEYKARENELHEEIREKNEYNTTCAQRFERMQNRLSSLQEESDRIGGRIYDDYEMTLEDALKMELPEITKQNRSEYAAIQSSCRAKLRAYGEFRPGAIEEYREVKERYDDLSAQVGDLDRAAEELNGVIEKIEEQMRTEFITAFDAINHHFGIVFSELFGGGQAELALTDAEDVLTSGIEIKAAPPGKIIKSLALLSGGEQTFVAIALIFAILKVNPTPFCIFDEIEAALDEVNVYRFADYINKLSVDGQFVLITHRRGTMEVGNRIYGITMPERGISRAVLLDVNEVERKKKEAESWDSSKN